jgi:dihydroorotate dehydrogenase electron transfer subunit
MLETSGTIVRNVPLSADAFWMEIEAPDVAAIALPGQFVMIRCWDGLDPLTARPFSIADVDGDTIAIAYVVVGRATKLMAGTAAGRRAHVLGPLGRPFTFEEKAAAHVMIAGGIGSAPFPLLARVLREADPAGARVLLYGGRSKEHLYFLDLFREVMTDVEIATDDGSAGRRGFVTDLLLPWLARPGVRLYACGPTPMFHALDRALAGSDIPCEISVEPIMACGFGACYGCVVPARRGEDFEYVKSCEKGPTFPIRDLVMDRLGAH